MAVTSTLFIYHMYALDFVRYQYTERLPDAAALSSRYRYPLPLPYWYLMAIFNCIA